MSPNPKIDPRTGLEELDCDECLDLVRGCAVGRIAVVVDEIPLVFPINFVLDGRVVVFRTDEGTKLYGARHGLVAFECDDIDRMYHTGWSVIVTGTAEEVREPAELARLARLPLGPWCPGDKAVWLRIRPRMISGRRIPMHGMNRTQAERGAET